MNPEFSRRIDARHLPERPLRLEADAAERAALAERFAVTTILRLKAEVALSPEDDAIRAEGRFEADLVQACAVSGEAFATRVAEPFAVRFVREGAPHKPDEEIELDAAACDEMTYEGTQIDLGEAIAQSLALAIDPYATGPDADTVREVVGLSNEATSGPFAALAALKK